VDGSAAAPGAGWQPASAVIKCARAAPHPRNDWFP
jgi:hypothetical protein